MRKKKKRNFKTFSLFSHCFFTFTFLSELGGFLCIIIFKKNHKTCLTIIFPYNTEEGTQTILLPLGFRFDIGHSH